MRIAIRADASVLMGSGHLMRCLTLADAMRRRGAITHFFTRPLPGHLTAEIERRGHPYTLLPAPSEPHEKLEAEGPYAVWHGTTWSTDAEQTATALQAFGTIDVLLVDAYGFGIEWERRLSSLAPVLGVIDDLPGRKHDCDLLLDPNLPLPGTSRQRDAPAARCLEGPNFAPLRDEFVEWREPSLSRRDGRPPESIVLFLGGSDAPNATLKILQAIPTAGWCVEALIGGANPHREEIERYASSHPHLVATFNSAQVAKKLAEADLAIGAAGASAWERCCLGVPSLSLSLADNQTRIAEELARCGATLNLGPLHTFDAETFRTLLADLKAQPHRCVELSNAAAQLVDGKGTERVVDAIYKATARPVDRTPIQLVRAVSGDVQRVFDWRNDERIRRFSHDPAELLFAKHEDWFRSTLEREDRELLIAEQAGKALGVLRFDLERSTATISVYLTPERIGSGLGSRLIHAGSLWLAAQRPDVSRVLAEIVPGNIASERAFARAGYEPVRPGLYALALAGDARPSPTESGP